MPRPHRSHPHCPICGAPSKRVDYQRKRRNGHARVERIYRETCGKRACVRILRARRSLDAMVPR